VKSIYVDTNIKEKSMAINISNNYIWYFNIIIILTVLINYTFNNIIHWEKKVVNLTKPFN